MRTYYGHKDKLVRWAQLKIGNITFTPHVQAIGVIDDDNRLRAVVTYDNFRPGDIEMSVAADSARWCTRRVLRQMFRYPFVQLDCRRVTAIVDDRNKHTQQFLERIGFQLEGRVRLGYDAESDALIYGLLRDEAARWLQEKANGEKRIELAATAA